MADAPGRPMKYPYTVSAKIAQFPYKLYWKNVWMFRYMAFALVAVTPLFYKIGKASYSPENVKKWDETRKKQWAGHAHDH